MGIKPHRAFVVMKHCSTCNTDKPFDCFYKNRGQADGHSTQCKYCRLAYAKKYRQQLSPAKRKEIDRKGTVAVYLGFSDQQYQDMYASQNGACKICGAVKNVLCIDHCHTTGTVRGLLCRSCNWGLGHFRDSPTNLTNAIDYLRGN